MRPLLLAALAIPFLHACANTCTTAGLQASLATLPPDDPAAVARMVADTCKLDEGLEAWLASPDTSPAGASALACPDGTLETEASPRLANRQATYETCGLEGVGLDRDAFLAGAGKLGLAAATSRALASRDDVDAATAAAVGNAMLGRADFAVPPGDVPRVVVDSPVDPGPPVLHVDADAIRIGDTTLALADVRSARPGTGDPRVVDALAEAAKGLTAPAVIAVPATLDGPTLARIIASLPEGRATLLAVATVDGKDHLPHGVSLAASADDAVTARPGPHAGGFTLYAADGSPKPPVGDCPTPGPTLCDADVAAVGSALANESSAAIAPIGTAADLATLATAVPGLALDSRIAPCLDAPDGMICVPGGPALVGTSSQHPGDGPALVSLSTFYLDASEATVADYKACMDAGACTPARLMDDPAMPAERLTFVQARELCTFEGKRLPTEWEWEHAARPVDAPRQAMKGGTTLPTCEVAVSSTCGGAPRAAAEGKDARGFANLLGNVAEYTSSYPQIGTETCGDACEGWDPAGPCDGAPMCKGRLTRVVRGGSFRDPAAAADPSFRSVVRKTSAIPGNGVRCASDGPVLDTFPPAWTAATPPAPATPAPLDDAARAVLAGIAEDKIDEIPECDDGRRGSSRTDCKDPTHYIYPNEDRAPITYPYIENRGGALLGVGSDQNYTFAAIARSELVFLMDYDAIVVHIHRVNQALIKHADSPDAFVALWDPANRDQALEIIGKEWEGDPMGPTYQRTLRSLNRIMHNHYTRTRQPSESGATSWLRDAEAYTYVRELWKGGRIVSLKGDMLGPNAMQGVGKALHELKVPMRIYYTSNAPNAWGGEMTASYKRNVRSFPMDEQSVVLQALGWTNEFGQTGHWHFNVQDGPEVQERLGKDGYVWLWQVVRPYRNTDDVDLTLSGLEGTWEASHTE